MKKASIEQIIEWSNRAVYDEEPVVLAMGLISNNADLLNIVEKNTKFIEYKIEMRKNLVVCIVTALEYFLNSKAQEILSKIGVNKDLFDKTIKYDIREVYDICKKRIHPEDIIIRSFNFQNLKDIDTFFKNAMNLRNSFFDEIKEYKIPRQDIEISKNFYSIWEEILKIRHEIVHDLTVITTRRLSNRKIQNYIDTSLSTFFIINEYVNNRIKVLISEKKNN